MEKADGVTKMDVINALITDLNGLSSPLVYKLSRDIPATQSKHHGPSRSKVVVAQLPGEGKST
jgi:hypothetical protein